MIPSWKAKELRKQGFLTEGIVYRNPYDARRWLVAFTTQEGHTEDLMNQKGELRQFASIDSAAKALLDFGFWEFSVNDNPENADMSGKVSKAILAYAERERKK